MNSSDILVFVAIIAYFAILFGLLEASFRVKNKTLKIVLILAGLIISSRLPVVGQALVILFLTVRKIKRYTITIPLGLSSLGFLATSFYYIGLNMDLTDFVSDSSQLSS